MAASAAVVVRASGGRRLVGGPRGWQRWQHSLWRSSSLSVAAVEFLAVAVTGVAPSASIHVRRRQKFLSGHGQNI